MIQTTQLDKKIEEIKLEIESLDKLNTYHYSKARDYIFQREAKKQILKDLLHLREPVKNEQDLIK